MGEFPAGLDPESRGSRFTSRAALAILTRRGGASRFTSGEDVGDAGIVVADALGAEPSALGQALGKATTVDGSYGRGAAGWVPIVEWTALAVIGGVVGNAAWESVKARAHELRSVIKRLRGDDVRFAISRGTAAHLAIAHVLAATEEDGILDVEAVAEPSALAGRPITELSYVEIEPWIVFLVNENRTARYVLAISSGGEVLNWMQLPMGRWEDMFGALPPRT